MLLESIKLINFRQFKEVSVDFSVDRNSNVTIIFGDNGTGKTTFAKAFLWCLYGDIGFLDRVLLNRHVAFNLTPLSDATVRVELFFEHCEIKYWLIREKVYRKDARGMLRGDEDRFSLAQKGEDGNWQWRFGPERERIVKTIIPQELSRYFFFDGERIENMSKNINNHERSEEFASAVKGCLGFFGMEKAIKHLSAQTGVIKSYERDYHTEGNTQMGELVREIEQLSHEQDSITEQINSNDDEINKASTEINQKKAELRRYEDSREIQERIESLERDIEEYEELADKQRKSLLDHFKAQVKPFFSLSLIYKALNFIGQTDIVGDSIPSVNDQTLNYLLSRRRCICGTCLEQGTEPFLKIQELLQFVPPQSIGTILNDFKKHINFLLSDSISLEHDVLEDERQKQSIKDKIDEKTEEVQFNSDKLNGEDVQARVREISQQIKECTEIVRTKTEDNACLHERLGALKERKDGAERRRTDLALLDNQNQMIDLYMAYARRILDELTNRYCVEEEEVRSNLQERINSIFRNIYNGGLSVVIDEKYRISVYSDQYNDGDVETSTAQSISVIFAFISGIIQIAREKADDPANEQVYPLVMDAPLSSLDRTRIESVCHTIPGIAEQVILVIKDTDGEIARQYLGNRIGKEYCFVKDDEFFTSINER